MGDLIQITIISPIVGKNPLEEMEQPSQSTKESKNAVLGCKLKNDRMFSVCFQGKPSHITVIQVYVLTSNEEAKVEWFSEDLQDLLEQTSKKDVLFLIGDWNAKVGSQELPG